MDWEKIFATDITHKGLIANIYKQFMKIDINKMNNQIKNGQKT